MRGYPSRRRLIASGFASTSGRASQRPSALGDTASQSAALASPPLLLNRMPSRLHGTDVIPRPSRRRFRSDQSPPCGLGMRQRQRCQRRECRREAAEPRRPAASGPASGELLKGGTVCLRRRTAVALVKQRALPSLGIVKRRSCRGGTHRRASRLRLNGGLIPTAHWRPGSKGPSLPHPQVENTRQEGSVAAQQPSTPPADSEYRRSELENFSDRRHLPCSPPDC